MRQLSIILQFLFAAATLQAQPVRVSFAEVQRVVDEFDDLSVRIIISEPAFLPIEVAYTIETPDGATQGDGEDDDFDIIPGEDDINLSPITIEPGETDYIIPVNINNDDIAEGDQTIIFRITASSVTVAQPIEPLEFTAIIRDDDDDLEVFFPIHSAEFDEHDNISIQFALTSPAPENVIVPFTVSNGTTTSDDWELADGGSTGEVTIIAGSTTGTLTIDIINDNDDEPSESETLSVSMGTPRIDDSTATIGNDERPFIATIVDNDPIELSVRILEGDDEPESFERTITEAQSTSFTIELSGAADEIINLPYSVSGTAVLGEESGEGDYFITESPIEIAAGSLTRALTIFGTNDSNIESDETIVITLGTPTLDEADTNLAFVGQNQLTVTLEDNDPVTLSFGVPFTRDDDDDDIEPEDKIGFIESGGLIVPERNGIVAIPMFLSDPASEDVTFTISLVPGQTTATLLETDEDPDEVDWDFAVANADINFDNGETNFETTIFTGATSFTLTLDLNNDEESPTVFGQNPPPDVEADETITFRLSALNTSESDVNFGAFIEFTVTIRDFPDIDITSLFTGLGVDSDTQANGGAFLNLLTGLFETRMAGQYTGGLDTSEFAGYRALKLQFNNHNYDEADPGNPANDPLITVPEDPEEDEEFTWFVDPPHDLRYSDGVDVFTVIEGLPLDDDEDFTEANADTILLVPYLLIPLDIPPLHDHEPTREEYRAIDGLAFDYFLEFTHGGRITMPLDRFDPGLDPQRLRVLLTADDVEPASSGTNRSALLDFIERDDGSIMIILNTASSSQVEIQYWDGEGEWKTARPGLFSVGGSRHWWIDQGPPKTEIHPSSVPLRFYRIINR